MTFEVLEQTFPKITDNYDEVKADLEAKLKDYTGLIVTEDTLSACKTAQKELASLRVQVDAYRKDVKKALSEPIVAFEDKCRNLIAMIEKAEVPIKAGIKAFDDVKREAKKHKAEQLIKETVERLGIRSEYASALIVLDKYMNLTAKESDVSDDIEARAIAIKAQQDQYDEKVATISTIIDMENEKLTAKMTISDFTVAIKTLPVAEIVKDVKARAVRIYAQEHPIPKEEPKTEETKAEPTEAVAVQPADNTQYYATFTIYGSKTELQSVSAFLRNNGLAYKVKEQGKV